MGSYPSSEKDLVLEVERQQSAQKISDYLQILNMRGKANMSVHIETVPAEELVR